MPVHTNASNKSVPRIGLHRHFILHILFTRRKKTKSTRSADQQSQDVSEFVQSHVIMHQNMMRSVTSPGDLSALSEHSRVNRRDVTMPVNVRKRPSLSQVNILFMYENTP